VVQAGAYPANFLRSDGYAFTALFLVGAIGGSIADAAAGEAIKIIDPEQVLSVTAYERWPQVWERSRTELGAADSFGGLPGNGQFRRKPPAAVPSYRSDPNDDQREFDRQLTKMNPDLGIPVPVRISQALADKRVQYEYEPPDLPGITVPQGTKALIEELKDKETHPGNDIVEKIYPEGDGEGEVNNDEQPLQAHFTTINADADALIEWLVKRGLGAWRHR
jgi:hypothetical protein